MNANEIIERITEVNAFYEEYGWDEDSAEDLFYAFRAAMSPEISSEDRLRILSVLMDR